jgi:hypothetical protein
MVSRLRGISAKSTPSLKSEPICGSIDLQMKKSTAAQAVLSPFIERNSYAWIRRKIHSACNSF